MSTHLNFTHFIFEGTQAIGPGLFSRDMVITILQIPVRRELL